MNRLTAIRSFGNSRYSPAKRTRVYDNRWYLVTLQNYSRDQGDGMYLEEGESVELMPGKKAREYRESRLNRCNRIVDYNGDVFRVSMPQTRTVAFYTTLAKATGAAERIVANNQKSLADALQYLGKQAALTDTEMIEFYGKCKDWPGNEVVRVKEYRQEIAKSVRRNMAYWSQAPVISRER